MLFEAGLNCCRGIAPCPCRCSGRRPSGDWAPLALYGEDVAEVRPLRSVLSEPPMDDDGRSRAKRGLRAPRGRAGKWAVLAYAGFGKLDLARVSGAGVSTTSREVSSALRNDSPIGRPFVHRSE